MKSRRSVTRTSQPKTPTRRSASASPSFTRWLAPPVVIFTLITGFGACGTGKPTGVVETVAIVECDAYASAYSACMSRLGVAASAPADRHLSTLRQEVAANPSDDAERERLRSSCVFEMHQLELACR